MKIKSLIITTLITSSFIAGSAYAQTASTAPGIDVYEDTMDKTLIINAAPLPEKEKLFRERVARVVPFVSADSTELIYKYVFEPMSLEDRRAKRKIDRATETVFFDFDEFTIKEEAYPVLKDVAKAMKKTDGFNLIIDGHADKVGTKEYNRELAMDRAREIYLHLLKEGVDNDRLFIRNYGESDPMAENPAFNRRVEFLISR